MFPMLWDVLPKYIDDWVNTAPMVKFLFGADGTQSRFWKFLLGMKDDGLSIEPEGIVNINAGMITAIKRVFSLTFWRSSASPASSIG